MDDSFDREQKGDSVTRFNRPKVPSKRKPAHNTSAKEETKSKSARLSPEAAQQHPSSCPYNLRSRGPVSSSAPSSSVPSRGKSTRCLLSRTSTQTACSEVAKLREKATSLSQTPLPSSGQDNKGNQELSDQPEPEGPRRSERIKKATGSCASNSRRGSQARKPSWTRRSSASMSADQDGRAEQGASSANAESAENEEEAHSLFESAELKDGELSRLHSLLEARGIPPHLLGSLGPRMHQLLSRTLSGGSGGKVQQLLTGIQSSDEGVQLQAVIEMCQFLVMGNEESLAAFPVKEVVPALVNLLSMEHNFDMMNHACRSLTYLMEALPRSAAVVVEAVPVFIEKVQVIQCMDVAEQALAALEMLSRRNGKAILQAGGMSACLLYLDFFSITAQRSALAVAANCCQNVTDFQIVSEAIPVLSARLQNQDKKSVDSCCLAFSRLVEVFHSNEKHLQEIASHGLLSNLQQLLIVTPPIISPGTFVMVLHLLAVVCANSPSLAATLLKQNISDTLQYLLVGTTDVMEANMELLPRIPQEFFELTCIVSELLPSLPNNEIFAVDSLLSKNRQTAEQGLWQWRDDRGIWHTYSWIDSKIIETAYQRREDEVSFTVMGRPYNIDFNTMQQINEDTGTPRPVQRSPGTTDSNEIPPKISATKTKTNKEDERLKALHEDKEVASGYFSGIFAVLYSICDSTVGPAIKHKCMNAILRMLYYSPPELLAVIVKKHRVSSLIGGMLKSEDLQILVNALQMAEILMQKLPEAFHVSFRREGVMHKIHDIAYVWSKEHVSANTSATAKESPLASDVKSQSPENSSMQPRRLGDILRRKRRSKRAVMKGKMQDANSNPKKTLEDDFHPIEPRECSFSISHERMLSELTSITPGSWGPRTLGGTLSAPVSQRNKFELGACAASPSSKSKVRLWIKEQAEKFCVAYFDKDQQETHPALDIMHRLRSAAEGLSLTNEDSLSALKEVCKCVSESTDSACTFEILHSGLVPKLLSYLSSTSSECVLPLEQRLKLFLCAFMGVSLQDSDKGSPSIGENDRKPALIPLLQKLHSCTNQLEQFPVNLNDTLTGLTGSGGSRGSQALRFFSTHQIKCQLQRHPSCVNVKQWKRGPVKIDPLALVQAIERYLVVRGFGRTREQGTDDEGSEDDGSDEDIDETMMKELQSESSTRHHIEILIGDHVLPYNMTVYQCIKQYGQFDEERDVNHDHGILGRPSIWIGTHTIWYRLVNQKDHSPGSKRKASGPPKAALKPSSRRSSKEDKSSLTQILSTCTPTIFSISDPCLEAVCLMKGLHALNSSWAELHQSTRVQKSQPFVSSAEFINHKLTAKVMRQLQDPITVITGNFPSWLNELPRKCPFLFPFECRQQLFFCTAFDRERAMIKLGETVPDLISTEVSDRVAPRIDRKKLKVAREGLFEQAEKLIENLGGSSSVLEVHYEGEVGTGLGPTLEFYALVSKEFQSSALEMWRGEISTPDVAGGSSYMFSSTGLFPAPLAKNAKQPLVNNVCSKFNFLGKFLARALMDFRMVDIPFSRTFYKWLLGQEDTLGLKDFEQVDAVLAQSIGHLYEVVLQKKRLEEDPEHTPQSLQLAIDSLTLEGDSIEDFGFMFVLPGHDDIELKKHGADTPVTIRNLEEYIKLVIHWSLVEGVKRQFQAFKEGFESVFPLSRLSIFTPSELELLLCGSAKESWNFDSLVKSCRPDHGYTQDSPTIKFLYEILVSYTSEEQRLFLQFVTGSPRLPVGGLRSLNPPLTIVRKTLEPPLCADNYLPSVMTCVNYLKLPDYSSKEIMSAKLRVAAMEGQRSFHLS